MEESPPEIKQVFTQIVSLHQEQNISLPEVCGNLHQEQKQVYTQCGRPGFPLLRQCKIPGI